MRKDVNMIGPMLQTFFADFLHSQKNVSPQTIAAYRDTFTLLLQFVQRELKIAPAELKIADLDVSVILAFLDHLEVQRRNSVRSRNARLAAIRSFFRMVALRHPESVNQCSRVLAVPVKRTDRRLVTSLTREELDALLAVHNVTSWSGRRDHALFLTFYNTGARVSEIVALERSQVSFGTTTFIRLHGKGRKERTVPLWPKTARTLRSWFRELSEIGNELAFPSAQGNMLTRNGVDYILQKSVTNAAANCPTLLKKNVTPHTLRHTTATHLLQSGVDTSVIALWLGHESTETTRAYLEADLATKEKALRALAPPGGSRAPRKFKASDKVLAFLAAL